MWKQTANSDLVVHANEFLKLADKLLEEKKKQSHEK